MKNRIYKFSALMLSPGRRLPRLLMIILFAAALAYSQNISLHPNYRNGDFKLVYRGVVADIIVSPDDFKVVQIAAGDLAADIRTVTGMGPRVIFQRNDLPKNIVIAGTIGKNPVIDTLVRNGKIDLKPVFGKRESFIITTAANPIPNVESALVIAGSDRRGTAFGIYELSQMIGVSPWHWWADVTPDHKSELIISSGRMIGREPSVKYRGIFLNDEDWGLEPWAAKTFEPETGNIGPKTYARVCELLLRLKANTLWPAMHEVTTPFNAIPANRQVADDYAIVMGSSHAEPMLRNNVGEWKTNKDDYNFVTNPAGVTEYWEQRVKENGKFENVYTIGMRGIHDSPIQGTKNQAERKPLLEKIFSVQRDLLSKYVNPDVEKVPQIFCPYKEVLADYRAGLRVPDDVTIVFPDDNFGYIRAFPTAKERQRKGGFGVYYHISYLGRPLSYLWLNTTPPAQIFEEMSKAYANGMRDLWILNVGDLKPAEIGIEFFMQMAYDAKRWTIKNEDQYLKTWASREFGPQYSSEIASIMDRYYRLGLQRKPEHLQWYLPGETPRSSGLSETETLARLDAYLDIRKRTEAVYKEIPQHKRDAFYELVLYPVRSAANANERYFAAELAHKYRSKGRADAVVWARRSVTADAEIAADARYFNETLANGKWRHIMSPEITAGQWPSMRSTPPKLDLSDFQTATIRAGRPDSTTDRAAHFDSGVISIEAEHFGGKTDKKGFGWQVIKGLGKTGDSVTVFPQIATTFANIPDAPSLDYQIDSRISSDFTIDLKLIPTQPLIAGNGLRLAFSVDNGSLQMIVVGKNTDVSTQKWSANIVDQTTVGTGSLHLTAGKHTLHIFAVDTGVVLDKIVIHSHELAPDYFGPPETSGR